MGPLAPNREDHILTSLALPSQWICLGPPHSSDSGVTNQKAAKSKLLKHVGRTLHNFTEDKAVKETLKNRNDTFDKAETEANVLKTHRSREDLVDKLQWPQVKSRGRESMEKLNENNGEEWREARRSSALEQKRSYSRAGGRKEGRQSWPFEGADWPEADGGGQREKKRSWSRAGGAKEGRQSWPFEGGDWPEAGNFEAEKEAIGGKDEGADAHWSQRKLHDPPKVQYEDQKKRQRYERKGD